MFRAKNNFAVLMKVLFNIFGVLLIMLSILALVLTMVDGVAIIFSLVILVMAGFMALTGILRYTFIVLLITTLNILSLTLIMPSVYQTEEYQENELPDYLPPIPRPFIPIEDLKEISKESGISLETLRKIPITEAKNVVEKKQRGFFGFLFLLKAISIPYIFTGLLLFIGFQIRSKNSLTN